MEPELTTQPNVFDQNCESRQTLDRVADKWSALVVYALVRGPLRHGQLKREIQGISQKMLTQTLRSMERDGLVVRRVFDHTIDRMTHTIGEVFPEGTRVTSPAGGFVLWLELPKPVKSRALFNAAVDEGICFAPGDVFSASSRYDNYLRLSCGHGWLPRIEKGLKTLGELACAALARS